ncbi:MAG: 2-amino-4-hydroxy-6-hydroxymethyldihydropteridine diphosphokinase [Bacteroidales bacterium]
MKKSLVYLGLGTNLGNLDLNLHKAIDEIGKRVGKVISQSAFYKTEPWGFESPHTFLNAVICIETELKPEEVLNKTQHIEKNLGRTKKSNGTYSDRIIDIDILIYDNLIMESETLTIPHPLLQLRDFVLIPLKEIAPDLRHPKSGIKISEYDTTKL